jgi:putative DNA primase/helicase
MLDTSKEEVHLYKDVIKETIEWALKEDLNFIPLNPKSKKPLKAWAEYQDRKITDEEIKKYFDNSKNYNIGILCGSISDNLFVVDCDKNEIFEDLFPEDKRKGLVIVKTPHGYHVYGKANDPVKPLKCFSADGQELLTLKAQGGYVVAPGSLNGDGDKYSFVQQGPIDRLNGDIREDLKKKALSLGFNFGSGKGNSETVDTEYLLKGVKRGGQDNAILMLSTYLIRQGDTLEYALEVLMKWRERCDPVIPKSEIEEKCKTHYRRSEPFGYYFKTNPATVSIKEDLTLEEQTTNTDAPKIEDVWYRDEKDKGRRKISTDILQAYVESTHIYKTLDDTMELLKYEDGIYVNGLHTLDYDIDAAIGTAGTIRSYREILRRVKIHTLVGRALFEVDPNYIAVENGILNLKTNELEPFNPERMFTYKLPIKFDKDAGYTHIDKFFREVLYDTDVEAMQETFGYSLYRGLPVQKMFWWLGSGANGKTTASKLLEMVLGKENVSHVTFNQLDGHDRFAVVRLIDKLVNIIPEPTIHGLDNTETVKILTGNDPISGEKKGLQDEISFTSYAKLVIHGNRVPTVKDKSYAWERRLLVTEFPYDFKENQKEDYEKTIIEQDSLEGLLNWMLVGLARLRKNHWKFTETNAMKDMKMRMKRESQLIPMFLENWCDVGNQFEISKDEFSKALQIYCDLYHLPLPDVKSIATELNNDSRITSQRPQYEGLRFYAWRGIKLKETIEVVIPLERTEKDIKNDLVTGVPAVDKFNQLPLAEYVALDECLCGLGFFQFCCEHGDKILLFEKEEDSPYTGVRMANTIGTEDTNIKKPREGVETPTSSSPPGDVCLSKNKLKNTSIEELFPACSSRQVHKDEEVK